jgi:endonuclease/exonuclease/phosphatase family metal-dependent hydrolase
VGDDSSPQADPAAIGAARTRGAAAQRHDDAGFGFTHPAVMRLRGRMPGVRIDHAYTTPHIRIHNFRTLDPVPGSDHDPILITLSIAEEPRPHADLPAER